MVADQVSTFDTLETAQAILEELTLSAAVRVTEGEVFPVRLSLFVDISEDETLPASLTLLVNRLPIAQINSGNIRWNTDVNGDFVIRTFAEMEIREGAFPIDILFRRDVDSKQTPAQVKVSPEMDEILKRPGAIS